MKRYIKYTSFDSRRYTNRSRSAIIDMYMSMNRTDRILCKLLGRIDRNYVLRSYVGR